MSAANNPYSTRAHAAWDRLRELKRAIKEATTPETKHRAATALLHAKHALEVTKERSDSASINRELSLARTAEQHAVILKATQRQQVQHQQAAQRRHLERINAERTAQALRAQVGADDKGVSNQGTPVAQQATRGRIINVSVRKARASASASEGGAA